MMKMPIGWIEALIILLLQVGCGGSSESAPEPAWRGGDSSYIFEEPDDVFTLDKELEEISGLTLMPNGLLGAVQDEKGNLYLLDPASGEIMETRKFGKAGDYEGLELGGGRLFIIRSDGRLHIFERWDAAELVGEAYDVDLVKGCDAEGIAYQTNLERLLISCKEKGGKNLNRQKAIFAYNADTRTLSEEPVYILDVEEFEASVDDHPINEAVRSVLSDRLDLSGFKPSDLAVHPHSGDIFIVSSVTKVVISMDESGEVKGMWPLPPEQFDQPEGMTFGRGGDLFISNEAGDRRYATLMRFRDRSSDTAPQPGNE